MAISLPTSADVREVRARAARAVNAPIDAVKTPLYAWVGAGDYAVTKVNDVVSEVRARAAERRELAVKRAKELKVEAGEVPGELDPDALRARIDDIADEARRAYNDLAERGEKAVERIRRQPRVKRVLDTISDTSDEANERIEHVVDEAHDAGEDALGRLSTKTRSTGEKAARSAQRFAAQAADAVSEAGDELAGTLQEAGDEAARSTRGASRKAANRTAPATDQRNGR